MNFLRTAPGVQLIATGKFNGTGALLVAGLQSNVKNVTVGINALANEINVGVRPTESPTKVHCALVSVSAKDFKDDLLCQLCVVTLHCWKSMYRWYLPYVS